MILRYCLLWLFLPLIGILNGAVREFAYKKAVGELAAHQISTLTGLILMGAFVWFVTRRWPLPSARQAIGIGLIWLLLTVTFEFGFGHFVAHTPWPVLLRDYNLREGRVWGLLVLWVAITPYLFYRMQRKSGGQRHPSRMESSGRPY